MQFNLFAGSILGKFHNDFKKYVVVFTLTTLYMSGLAGPEQIKMLDEIQETGQVCSVHILHYFW